MNYLEALTKRYSVKKFDKNKKVPSDVLEKILEAGKLSVSSLGLQPYVVYVAESEEIKEKLTPAFGNPSQISTCSHLLVLVTKKKVEDKYLDGYFNHISEVRNTNLEDLKLFRNSIELFLERIKHDEMLHWNEKQTYILLGNLVFAAALEGVDTCPMEGIIQSKIDEALGLDTASEKVTVTLALGYRADDDRFQHNKKVRKPSEKLFKFL